MSKKSFLIISSIVAFLLLIPIIAMQYTEEVDWNLMDFVIAGSLLYGLGFMLDMVIRKVNKLSFRILLGICILILFLLLWAELAVGILETLLSGN